MQSKAVIARHPMYPKILAVYREEFISNGGKMNDKRFWRTHIQPVAPNVNVLAWYRFIRKFRKESGWVASHAIATVAAGPKTTEEKKLDRAMMTNDAATQLAINSALQIGAITLSELLNDPQKLADMSVKDRTDLVFKAMKSQDSRIHAIGKLKEDNREQAKFDRAFDGAF